MPNQFEAHHDRARYQRALAWIAGACLSILAFMMANTAEARGGVARIRLVLTDQVDLNPDGADELSEFELKVLTHE